ncbi:MAG TPA: D-glycero-beta-D-manno-heptose-7-phosphate kinase, partial [Accumulibacter sp.]|nr:D-glycero-beta-D-manno-heptose-7-phosphate kinase [Accumulibacter sp.]
DTVIATLAVMLACGADWPEAVHAANVAAGVVVGKLGTAVVGRAELNAALN